MMDNPPAHTLEGKRIVVASHNAGKLREFGDLMAPFGFEAKSAKEYGLPEPEETGTTFEENAYIKAFAAAQATGLPALSDDSGLEVEALGGDPGVYSARWAGPSKDFGAAMKRVADELTKRGAWSGAGPRANFTCALSLAWPDGVAHIFEGKVFGRLVWPPRGAQGFGYDPKFQPDGEALTFGEMDPAAKHAISHRARAFALFVDACLSGRQS